MMRTGLWTLLFIILLTLNISTSIAGREESESESEHNEHAEKEAQEAHGEADETAGVVTLDAEALAKSGIVAAPPISLAGKTERQITGTVLDSGELLELCRRHAAARERAPELLPALERGDGGIAQGLSGSSPVCTQLVEARGTLIEVTQPASDAQSLPPTIWLERRQGASEPAQQMSLAVKTDSPARKYTYYLLRDPSNDLTPGQAVTLRFAAEAMHRSVRVPDSAVVWLDGKPWVYVEESGGRFVRREFGAHGVAPSERVVVSGAQMLLSQELRSQIHAGEEGEHEESEQGEKK